MIYRPIFLSCDICGFERKPTEGQDRETLASAFKLARDEGWAVRKNGAQIYCPYCMGALEPDIDVAIDIEIDSKDGVVGISLVPIG